MFTQELIRLYPTKRIRAIDGMAVTSELWEEAHEYHRNLLQFHSILHHGTGIVTGLEVIASDPPDTSIYLQPGIAIDSVGQTLVVPEPQSYDLGNASGMLYIVLTYTESPPRPDETDMNADALNVTAPLYIHIHYSLEALNKPPDTPYVEVARIRRTSGGQLIHMPKDPSKPHANELDLRFRQEIGAPGLDMASVGIVFLGNAQNSDAAQKHEQGWENLARTLRTTGHQKVWVDAHLPLDQSLNNYTILALVAEGPFQLSVDQMNVLYEFLRNGGTIFFEGCRRNAGQTPNRGSGLGFGGRSGGDDGNGADESFRQILASIGVLDSMRPVPMGHEILQSPHLFGAPPDGFESQGTPSVQIGSGDLGAGVIVSTYDYGCLWAGERRNQRYATRNEIRNAIEWGHNCIDYAQARRQNQS
ncbi:MAG: DUF4159 domain-containing protein [Chloroflexota bacterium]